MRDEVPLIPEAKSEESLKTVTYEDWNTAKQGNLTLAGVTL